MVSTETLIIYPGWELTFTVHTYTSNKQLGSVISQNNKPISFFSRIQAIHSVITLSQEVPYQS